MSPSQDDGGAVDEFSQAQPPSTAPEDVPTPTAGACAATDAVATVAAPVLAGFALTVLILLLPDLENTERTYAKLPNLTLTLLVLAVLALGASLESGVHAKVHQADGTAAWEANDRQAWLKWAVRASRCYNVGLIALLAGLTSALIPPANYTFERMLAVGLAGAGAGAELAWFTAAELKARREGRAARS